jgi:preprotein translocase subunit SecG
MDMLAQMSWGESALAWLFILVCCFLMLVILLQRGRGGGLSAAFGGGGGASAAFGAKTGDVFTWITVIGAAIFVLLAVLANYAFDKSLPTESAQQVTTTTTESPTPGEEGEAGTAAVMPIVQEGAETQVPVGGEEPSGETEVATEDEGAAPAEDSSPDSADGPTPAPEASPSEGTGDEAPEPRDSGAKEQPGP